MVQADRLSTTRCAVAPLAEEAAFTARSFSRGMAPEDLCFAQDRMDALADAASHLVAESALGAYFQALLVLGDLDPEMNYLCDDEISRRTVRRQRRLMASVALRLREQAPASAATALESFYGSPLRMRA